MSKTLVPGLNLFHDFPFLFCFVRNSNYCTCLIGIFRERYTTEPFGYAMGWVKCEKISRTCLLILQPEYLNISFFFFPTSAAKKVNIVLPYNQCLQRWWREWIIWNRMRFLWTHEKNEEEKKKEGKKMYSNIEKSIHDALNSINRLNSYVCFLSFFLFPASMCMCRFFFELMMLNRILFLSNTHFNKHSREQIPNIQKEQKYSVIVQRKRATKQTKFK